MSTLKNISYSIYPCLYHLQWEWAHWKTCHIAFIPAFIIYNENEHIEKHIIQHLSLLLSSTTRMSTLKNISYSIYPCLYHLQREWAHWKTYHIAFIPAFIIYNENEHIEKHIISHLSLPLSSTTMRMTTLKNISYSIYPCLYHLQREWAHWKTYHIAFIRAFIIYNENEHIEKHIT